MDYFYFGSLSFLIGIALVVICFFGAMMYAMYCSLDKKLNDALRRNETLQAINRDLGSGDKIMQDINKAMKAFTDSLYTDPPQPKIPGLGTDEVY